MIKKTIAMMALLLTLGYTANSTPSPISKGDGKKGFVTVQAGTFGFNGDKADGHLGLNKGYGIQGSLIIGANLKNLLHKPLNYDVEPYVKTTISRNNYEGLNFWDNSIGMGLNLILNKGNTFLFGNLEAGWDFYENQYFNGKSLNGLGIKSFYGRQMETYFGIGAGVNVRVAKDLSIIASGMLKGYRTDKLDGYNKPGTNDDYITSASLGLRYNFGSKNKSLFQSIKDFFINRNKEVKRQKTKNSYNYNKREVDRRLGNLESKGIFNNGVDTTYQESVNISNNKPEIEILDTIVSKEVLDTVSEAKVLESKVNDTIPKYQKVSFVDEINNVKDTSYNKQELGEEVAFEEIKNDSVFVGEYKTVLVKLGENLTDILIRENGFTSQKDLKKQVEETANLTSKYNPDLSEKINQVDKNGWKAPLIHEGDTLYIPVIKDNSTSSNDNILLPQYSKTGLEDVANAFNSTKSLRKFEANTNNLGYDNAYEVLNFARENGNSIRTNKKVLDKMDIKYELIANSLGHYLNSGGTVKDTLNWINKKFGVSMSESTFRNYKNHFTAEFGVNKINKTNRNAQELFNQVMTAYVKQV